MFHKACIRRVPVHDVLALRIVLRSENTAACYAAHRIVLGLWSARPNRCKDYVHAPKLNGYRALHETVLLPRGRPMEVQIRTGEMHRLAEWGEASHRAYKGLCFDYPSRLLSDLASLGA